MKYYKTLICLSFPAWDGDYTKSTVELMKEYSKFQKVLFIDYPYTLLDLLRNKNAPIGRILNGNGLTPKDFPNLTVYNLPAILPFQRIKLKALFNLILFINNWLINKRIAKIRKKEKISNAEWLCALNPIVGNRIAANYTHEDFNYYCYDDISSMQWVHKLSANEEVRFIKKAKNVFCTSNKLIEKCKTYNKQVYLIENGVNLNIFHTPVNENTNSNIVGYIGSIDDRLDLQLLEHLITSNKNYKFQFIGRVLDEKLKETLSKYHNTEFIPAMEPTLLSNYVAKFSIGIIPFVKNSFTENIFPMKVNEYLAMGIPVVSTNFSDLSSLGSIIRISNTNNEFQTYLTDEIQTDTDAKKQLRIEHAKAQSWAKKAFNVHAVLSNQ